MSAIAGTLPLATIQDPHPMLQDLWNWMTGKKAPRKGDAMSLFLGSGVGTPTPPLTSLLWTDSRYEQVRHFRNWVYVAIDRIATDFAMHAPNVSYLREQKISKDRGSPQKLLSYGTVYPGSGISRRKALTPLRAHEMLEPVSSDHPAARLLQDPNEPDTAFDLWYETILFFLLTGNSYWWLPLNPQTKKPAAIWVIPSHWVWPIPGRNSLVEAYDIRPVEGNFLRQTLPADEIIHFRKKSPISKFDGHAPLTAGNNWIDIQEAIDRTRWFTFRNGIFPNAVIEFAENVKNPTEEVLNRIEAKFLNRYASEINAHKPIFLPPGTKLNKFQLTPHELDFNASADGIRDQVLALFSVPATVVGLNKNMTYGSVMASLCAYFMGCLNPLYRAMGQVLTEKYSRRWDQNLRVWWEDRTPEDPELLEKTIHTDFLVGAITPNEVRALRGREPYPHGGDNPLIQGALIELPYGTGEQVYNPQKDTGGNSAQAQSLNPQFLEENEV
jgi:HK97 family phage portal protein